MNRVKGIIMISILPGILWSQTFDGYTIFSPVIGGPGNEVNGTSFLIDNGLNVVHAWHHSRGAASMPYLLPDSTIIYPYRVPSPTMVNGGVGGGFARIDWEDNILWEYTISNDSYQHHHDIEPFTKWKYFGHRMGKKNSGRSLCHGTAND